MHRLVSPFILEKYAASEDSGQLDAATLFVDMSGFSAMTSALMAHGQHGAEVLATVMRAIFDPLVEAVYGHGGFITVFAGDAFTAVFPTPIRGDGRGGVTPPLRALAAAWAMREHILAHPSYTTPYGEFTVAAKIGLAAGEVTWGIIRSVDNSRAAFYFRGPAIDACAEAEKHARRGDLVLHPSVQMPLAGHVSGESANDYLRVTGLTGARPLPQPQPVNLPPVSVQVESRFFPRDIVEQPQTGEFRQVINVFVSLEGAPAAAQLHEFMQSVFRLQAKYGGLFNRLDFGDKGCSLLLFWGAPVSHEDDILRALNFLLELHDHTHIPIRAGVTSHIAHAGFIGSALHEEYTCYGNGVNLAARLMTSAPWESIWLDDPVRIRAEYQFELAPEGHLPFKGFAEELAVYSLLGHKTAETLDFYEWKMVGRQRELAVLGEFVRPIFDSEREDRFAGILVVRGEAGIGKSRLIHDFQTQHLPAALAKTVELVPRWCRCQSDHIVRQPLNPFRYWLQDYFGQSSMQSEAYNKRVFSHRLSQMLNATPDPALRQELERTRSVIGALVDLFWEDSLYASLDPQSRYESVLGALKTFILAESLRQPLVLHLEDVHWLDDDSVVFVQRLVHDVQSYPIAILAATRPEGDAPLFGPGVDYQTLDLVGLSDEDLVILAQDILGSPAGPSLLRLLSERSDGNPFFAEQILFYLRDERSLEPGPAGIEVREEALRTAPLPTNVRAIFIARLDRLAHDVREVVQSAAVLGREFEVQVLARMLRNQAVQPSVDEAEHAAIWMHLTEVRYLFKHVLLRDAAYDMQVSARRAELHQLAAQALETLHADDLSVHCAEIAHHYEAAYQSGLAELATQARTYLTQAGEQAAGRYENTTAINYFTRALALTPDEDLVARFDLLMAREAMLDNRGQRAPQAADIASLEALAEALEDDRRRAEAALRRANYGDKTSDFDGAIAAAGRAIALAQAAGDVALEAQGHFKWGDALERRADYAESRAQLEQALALAQGGNLASVEADVRYLLGFVAVRQGEWAEAERQIGQALPIFRGRGDLAGEMRCANILGITCFDQADFASALTYFEQALSLARQTGRRLFEANYLNNVANAWSNLREWARARTIYEQSLRVCQEIGHRDGEAFVFNNMGMLAIRMGDLERGQALHQQGLTIAREVGNRGEESGALTGLGWRHVLGGDYELAREEGRQALQIARGVRYRSHEGVSLIILGNALAGLGRLGEAQQSYQAALEVRETLNQRDATMDARAGLARIALAQGHLDAALAQAQVIADHIRSATTGNSVLPGVAGADDPLWVYLTWHQAWAAAGDPAASEPLERAYAILQAIAARLPDDVQRQMYLQNFPYHREIVAIYQALKGRKSPTEATPKPVAPAPPVGGEAAPVRPAGETLAGASLRGADLSRRDLRGGDLSGSDLRGADLSHAQLCGADLGRADLRGTDLTGADLRGANLAGAHLRGADLTGATWDEGTRWPEGFDPTEAA